jgi:hypothetical protein
LHWLAIMIAKCDLVFQSNQLIKPYFYYEPKSLFHDQNIKTSECLNSNEKNEIKWNCNWVKIYIYSTNYIFNQNIVYKMKFTSKIGKR